jgi:hypothetical protein
MIVEDISNGRGGSVVIIGDNENEVRERAKQERQEIDFMRSPSFDGIVKKMPNGEYVAKVTYWGLD